MFFSHKTAQLLPQGISTNCTRNAQCQMYRPPSASASAVLRCRTKTGVHAARMSAKQSINRTACSPDGAGKHQPKEH